MAREQRQLGRMMRQLLEHRESMRRGKLPDRVHPGIEVEGREAASRVADLGNAQPDLIPDGRERIGCQSVPPVERRFAENG